MCSDFYTFGRNSECELSEVVRQRTANRAQNLRRSMMVWHLRVIAAAREKHNLFGMIGITLAALAWLVLRTGTRFDRIRYPCQRASLQMVFLGIPVVASLAAGNRAKNRKWSKKRIAFLTSGIVVAGMVLLIASNPFIFKGLYANLKPGRSYVQNRDLTITELHSDAPVSTVYVAKGKDPAHSLNSLLSLMEDKGLPIYQTSQREGIIGKEDTVLIKINGEWQERGGTNTDLLKAFIQKVIDHPEGFAGEIAVVENGQWAIYLDSDRSNAEERTQSFQKVVNYFENQGYKVSLYDWTGIGGTAGDVIVIQENEREKDGYVDMPGGVSYPIFTTKFGTRISLKDGILKEDKYEKSHLKFINMPVLKSHSLMGVTAATKHYMGVLSTSLCNDGFDKHQGMIDEGLMGRMMAQVIYPDLNVIDANYIGVSSRGPASSYDSAYKANLVLAGQDPIALDYYAAKYILYPLTKFERHNPDCRETRKTSRYWGYPYNAFYQYLTSSKKELEKSGYKLTMNEKEIQVFAAAVKAISRDTHG